MSEYIKYVSTFWDTKGKRSTSFKSRKKTSGEEKAASLCA